MKTIRKLIATSLTLSLMMQVSAQETTQYLSLDKACQLGINNNIEITNAILENQKSVYQVQEVKSKLYPQIEGYSDFSYYYAIPKMLFPGEFFGQTGDISVEIGTKYDWLSGLKASLNLYNLSYFTSIKVAQSMQTINRLGLQQKKEELAYSISQVYYLCKTTTSQIRYLNNIMKDTDRLLGILKLQRDNGVARKIDYSKVLVSKNNQQTQIDNLFQLYQQQLGLLKFMIGMNQVENVELTDSLSFTLTVQNVETPDFNRQTEIALLDKQIEVSSLNLKANQQAYLPTLSGSAQLYFDGQQNEFNYFKGGSGKFFKVGTIGLSLNVPIFDGFEKHSKTKQYTIELQQLHNSRQNSSNNFNRNYIDAVRQYTNSINALVRQRENIKIAEDDYNLTFEGYHQQIVSLSDLMLSENSLTEAQLSYVNALLQLKNAELDVKKAKGELLNY